MNQNLGRLRTRKRAARPGWPRLAHPAAQGRNANAELAGVRSTWRRHTSFSPWARSSLIVCSRHTST